MRKTRNQHRIINLVATRSHLCQLTGQPIPTIVHKLATQAATRATTR